MSHSVWGAAVGRAAAAPAVLAAAVLLLCGSARADDLLKCSAFTQTLLPVPVAQDDPEARERFAAIDREVKAGPNGVLFLGDSLTQKWDPAVWERYFAPLGALNAGVNGDRTEHLQWRLRHGTLDGQPPRGIVLLIGTNDIGRNRPDRIVAEGIRANLQLLRERLPQARILLLGILPRGEYPTFRRRAQVKGVNALIRRCADGEHVHYSDPGQVLLDSRGVMSRAISPDGVHLSPRGYALLGSPVQVALIKMLGQTVGRRK